LWNEWENTRVLYFHSLRIHKTARTKTKAIRNKKKINRQRIKSKEGNLKPHLIQCDNTSPFWRHISFNLLSIIITYVQLRPLLIYCCSVKYLTHIHSWNVIFLSIRMRKLIPEEIFACFCLFTHSYIAQWVRTCLW
jgi:hypothetical protein